MHPDHMEPMGSCSICGTALYSDQGLCGNCDLLRAAVNDAITNEERFRWLISKVTGAVLKSMSSYWGTKKERANA